MITPGKILLTIWITAIATFALTAAYIVPLDARINVPGELGEVFAGASFIVLIALVIVSVIFSVVIRKK